MCELAWTDIKDLVEVSMEIMDLGTLDTYFGFGDSLVDVIRHCGSKQRCQATNL